MDTISAPKPFHVNVPEADLDDLRNRLSRTRFLPDSPNRPPSGMSSNYLQELVRSWQSLDWAGCENWLNQHPQFTVDIDDCDLHFVHLRSEREPAPALVVMHGWPHTFAMQLPFANHLPDFHVVVVSLPGFAYSSAYRTGVWSTERVTDTVHHLMTEVLGYSHFITYGEDVSAYINDLLAARYPQNVDGIIVTHSHSPSDEERSQLTNPEELAFFKRLNEAGHDASGYAHEQGTRPDTLAAGLNDSPAGLLAWITEKLVEWSDTPPGDPRQIEQRISRERILTEAMIYWTTQSIATSFAPYVEDEGYPAGYDSVSVPAAVFIQRHEWDYPESLARNYYLDLREFDRLEAGDHFAIAEVPGDLANRVRKFATDIGVLWARSTAPVGYHAFKHIRHLSDGIHINPLFPGVCTVPIGTKEQERNAGRVQNGLLAGLALVPSQIRRDDARITRFRPTSRFGHLPCSYRRAARNYIQRDRNCRPILFAIGVNQTSNHNLIFVDGVYNTR